METKKEITQIKKRLENYEERMSRLESLLRASQAKPGSMGKKTSIKEFILSKKPKKDIRKTLAIGYYLEKYKKLPFFNKEDLKKGFKSAKEKVPINIVDKVQKNITKGHMMEAKEKKNNFKAWFLTNSGEQYVINNFQKEE